MAPKCILGLLNVVKWPGLLNHSHTCLTNINETPQERKGNTGLPLVKSMWISKKSPGGWESFSPHKMWTNDGQGRGPRKSLSHKNENFILSFFLFHLFLYLCGPISYKQVLCMTYFIFVWLAFGTFTLIVRKKKSLACVHNINFTVNKQKLTLFSDLFERNAVDSLG